MSDTENISATSDLATETTQPEETASHDAGDIAQISNSLEVEALPSSTKSKATARAILHDDTNQTPDSGSDIGSLDSHSIDQPPRNVGSPGGSVISAPNRSSSLQGSRVSSPGSSVLPSIATRPSLNSPAPSFRPFDRRFQSRIPSSSNLSSRTSSPAFLNSHSRNVSLSSNFQLDQVDSETSSPPWEVVRWTKLKKLNGQAFSESGKRNFGSPTCLAVSASIVLGTSKGVILIFDYSQNLKLIIGPGTKAAESGAITAIAISADHTTIAGGHANGNIFTWDTSRPSRPFLSILHLDVDNAQHRVIDGHMPDVSIAHIGFLGTRHTALVSADGRGMAFSHLATRGTGALGRSVKTTRILGRYPDAPEPTGKNIKPSTVFAFAPLPLGNVERSTDTMGLTAMLTPYLLVIVSTTPVAQTQHKSVRPKDIAAHGAMTGCLAWFPAVKLKVPDAHSGSDLSKAKLVYCWSNVLTVLDVSEEPSDDPDQPPTLSFKARNRWNCDEAIVSVQWLSRSVLTVLTISQQLIVLEDRSMRMTEAFDLLQNYIYHVDLFSSQLHSLVERLDEYDQSMHGVVADAFYMSFKSYKGRIFILGFNEVSIGALSNWADRLIAMMEHGDYIGAIQLATSYYTGDADKLTVGLPEHQDTRHTIVRDKVMEIVSASLKYAITKRQAHAEEVDDDHLKRLAETCFAACLSVGNTDFLLDDMYEWYGEADVTGIFLESLEPNILDQSITIIPPIVVKDLVSHYVYQGWESRLEELICHMETSTLDIDQITLLCKQHSLYDALIYVWNRALNDYVTPLIDLLSLVVPLTIDGEYSQESAGDDYFSINAVKIFPYLSYTLSRRVYPNGETIDEKQANKAMSEIYWFFFSGQSITWPKGSGREFSTRPTGETEPAFPYLRLILKYDAPSFLSALNEAFEDSFLNDSADKHVNGEARMEMAEEQIFGMTINRQYIVSILLDVMSPKDFAPSDTIYLDMFIARNLPKFPQYLLFSGSTLSKVLLGLCHYPGEDLAEDSQLSAEYLLSVYHPTDMDALLPLYKEAGFYRILKRILRADKQYGKLIDTYFEDPQEQELVFACIAQLTRPQHGLDASQQRDVMETVGRHARDLLELNAGITASTLLMQEPEVHHQMLRSAEDRPELQFSYLHSLLETSNETPQSGRPDQVLLEYYVRLMCRFDPERVSAYIDSIQSAELRLEEVLPAMEDSGVIDGAVVLMVREGQINAAMDRLVQHLCRLESALQGLLQGSEKETEDKVFLQESVEQALQSLQKYIYVGVWLCQGQSKVSKRIQPVSKKNVTGESVLTLDESLWLKLIEVAVQLTRRLSPMIQNAARATEVKEESAVVLLRSLVQHVFTSLLTSTSSQTSTKGRLQSGAGPGTSVSFLRILRAFLAKAATESPNLADLRGVLASIFSAYAYEESILRLSNRLLERSLFVNVKQAADLRQRGWRPRGSNCEACGRRVWGPGVAGGAVYDAWVERQAAEEGAKQDKRAHSTEQSNDSESRGKGKGLDTRPLPDIVADTEIEGVKQESRLERLVLLACRHIYHQGCLDELQNKENNAASGHEREYRCPIDG